MSIDLHLIRYATALAEHGSFTRAADESVEILERLSPIPARLFARAGHPLTMRPVTLRDALAFPLIQVSRLP